MGNLTVPLRVGKVGGEIEAVVWRVFLEGRGGEVWWYGVFRRQGVLWGYCLIPVWQPGLGGGGGKAGLLGHLLGGGGPVAVDGAKGGLNSVLIGYFDTEKPSHNGISVLNL